MRILLIGGSGYFGTLLNSRLADHGYEVESIDAGFFRECWLGDTVRLSEIYSRAETVSEHLISSFDAVVMLAAISNDPLKQVSESELYRPSELFTENIATICRKSGIRFIFASSCSVYGNQQQIATEKSSLDPKTPYSANKAKIEQNLLTLSRDGWRPLILRFATIYGPSPRMRFDTVANMFCGLSIVERCIVLNSNGRALRPFLFIEDAISVIKWFVSLPLEEYEKLITENPIFNVGANDSNLSITGLAELVAHLSGGIPIKGIDQIGLRNEVLEDRKIREGVDSRSYQVSFGKIASVLPANFRFARLESGLIETLEYLLKIPLDKSNFYSKRYYRLQYLEDLIDSKVIDKSLNYLV